MQSNSLEASNTKQPSDIEYSKHSVRGKQIKSNQIKSSFEAVTEPDQNKTAHLREKNSKEERYSLRKLAKTFFFNEDHEQNFKYTNHSYEPLKYLYDNGYNYEFKNKAIDLNINRPEFFKHGNFPEFYWDGKNYNTNLGKNITKYEEDRAMMSMKKNPQDGIDECIVNMQKTVGLYNKKSSRILRANESIINESDNKIREMTIRYNEMSQEFKIVAITSIPKRMSISTLLSQTYGGPIEKIELVRRDNYKFYNNDEDFFKVNKIINWDEVSVFLHFNKVEDAKEFYQYSKSGMFRVNDVYLKTVWIPIANNDKDDDDKKYKDLMVTNSMEGEQTARRVLVFKKPIVDNRYKHGKYHQGKTDSNPKLVLYYNEDFNVDEIRKDFEEYGKIVEILPVVSRKLCFGIEYYDVRSAIKVKNLIEQTTEEQDSNERDNRLKRKYHGWYVWYGRDPADKAVPN